MPHRWWGSALLPAWKRRAGVVLGACAIMSAAACGDAPPTAPGLEPAGAKLLAAGGAGAGEGRAYLCHVSRRTPEGPYRYGYGRRWLHFPQKMIAPDGRLTMYRLRLGGPGGELSAAANCLIPATWEAVAHANRLFGVREEQHSHLMGTTITLETLEVNACPSGYTGTYPDCKKNVADEGGGPSGTSVGEPGSSGGGDDADPGEPEEEDALTTTPPDCSNPQSLQYPGERAFCAGAQRTGVSRSGVAGCYALEIGAWDAALREDHHPSPSTLPAGLRLDTVRLAEEPREEWYRVGSMTGDSARIAFSIWRPLAPDSVLIPNYLPMGGFRIHAEATGSTLRGWVIAFTDAIIPGIPSEVRAPLLGRRLNCPA